MRFSYVGFGLPYLLIELFYNGLPVVRTVGRSGGVRSRDYPANFLGWVDLLGYGAPHASGSRGRGAPLSSDS